MLRLFMALFLLIVMLLRIWVGSINDDVSSSALVALLMQVCLMYSDLCVIGFHGKSIKFAN